MVKVIKMKSISILGTLYFIVYVDNIDGNTDLAGKTDFENKHIYFLKDISQEEYKIVFKHEVIHAFLYESGLNKYNKDEMLIDYLAMQWDKLGEIFNKELVDGE